MNLKEIILETKVVTVPFDGIEGFEVKIAALSRELSRKIQTESETTKIDPKLRMPVTELDKEKFVEKFAEAAIKGWSGLKYKHLSELLLVDTSQIEDPEAEVEFSVDNAIQLISHSQIFDSWVNDQVFSLHRFRD
jgi:hypothetical protein